MNVEVGAFEDGKKGAAVGVEGWQWKAVGGDGQVELTILTYMHENVITKSLCVLT